MNETSTEHLLQGCLYFTTAKLDRLLTRWAEEAFAGTGLSPNHAFAVLLVNEKPGMNQTDLSSVLNLSPSTLTRFIDKLESKGWMTRTQDGRQTLLHPTAKGTQNQALLAAGWAEFWKRYTDILGIDEGNGLAATLNRTAARLQDGETQADD